MTDYGTPLLSEVNERNSDIYSSYRLKAMQYDYKRNVCGIFINYLPSDNIKDHRVIEKSLREILPLECAYDFFYAKVSADRQSILEFLQAYLQKSIDYAPEKNNYIIDLINNKIEILLPETEYELAKSIRLTKSLEKELDENFCTAFSVSLTLSEAGTPQDFNEIKAILDEGIAELKKNAVMQKAVQRSYKVMQLEKYIGEIIQDDALYIKDAVPGEERVVFAGTVTHPEIITRTKKDDAAKEFTMCKFFLKDFTSAIECVIFATKANLKKLEGIADNESIIASGYVNAGYNGGAPSFRINALSYCKLPVGLKEAIFKKQPPAKYEVIFPKTYIDTTQQDFFYVEKSIPLGLSNRTFVVIDTETTGINPVVDRITEVACVKIKNGRIIETLTSLVNPKRPIPERVTEITGISDGMVADAPTFDKIAGDLMLFCKDADLVGHNIMFDIGMLNNTAFQTHYYFEHNTVDTLSIAKRKIKNIQNYKLSTVAEKFGIINTEAHRALSDALVTAKLFIELSD